MNTRALIISLAVFICVGAQAAWPCAGLFNRISQSFTNAWTGTMDTFKLTTGSAVSDLDAADYELFRRALGEQHKSLTQVLSGKEISALKAKGSWDKLKRAFSESRAALELDVQDLAILRRALGERNKPFEHLFTADEVQKMRDKGTLEQVKEALEGDGECLSGVRWQRRGEDEVSVAARSVFLFVGADPNSGWLADCGVQVDQHGFVMTGTDVMMARCRVTGQMLNPDGSLHGHLETTVPGVFAIGDLRAGSTKRVAAAVGEGAAVVAQLHAYLAVPR